MSNMNSKLASIEERIAAYVIDVSVLILIVLALTSIISVITIRKLTILQNGLIGIGLNLLFIFRDIYGKGPGKSIMKIRIIRIDKNDGAPSPIQLLLRYFALCIWPIDVWIYMKTSFQYRWGDQISKTRVVREK
jgi:uncharacterized RDD family membrane protein YckC